MTGHWMQMLLALGVQNLWQGALLCLLAALLPGPGRLGAEARSWLLCAAFVLAAALPLAVLMPRQAPPMDPVASSRVQEPLRSSMATPHDPVHRKDAVTPLATDQSQPAPKVLALAWLLGALWSLGRVVAGGLQAQRIRAAAQRAPDLERLMASELPGGASIAFSDVPGPMVVGLRRPCILVPRRFADVLEPSALVDLLRHEIAHIHRRDLWTGTVQRLILGLYWWNPFMRLLGKRLDLVREMACDERAAVRSGGGHAYAHSLLAGADTWRASRAHPGILAVGMFGNRTGLSRRIDGLIDLQARPARRGAGVAWIALCLLALAAHVGVTLAATPRLGRNAASPSAPNTAMQANSSAQARQLVDAAAAGRLDEVQLLLRGGVDIDSRAEGDGTALIVAARNGRLDMVEELLALGAHPDSHSPGDGNPLIVAAGGGHLDIVKQLVAAGADVNRVVTYDETPLINASRAGHLATVAYLVEHGADVNLGVVADLGRWRSPLNQARDPEVRKYLLAHGAADGKRS